MTTIPNIHNHILKKIQSGAIRQRPKWHFLIATLALVFGLISLFLVFLYLMSFIALILREHFIFEAVSFGPATVFSLMHTLPFLLVLLVVTVFLLLHLLVRHFAFAYMKPVMLTLGGGLAITFIVFASVLLIDKDSRIARLGEGQHVPGVDALHKRWRGQKPARIIHAQIKEVRADGYVVVDDMNKELYVYVTDMTQLDRLSYVVGDSIVILTEWREGLLYALGIRMDNAIAPSTPVH